MLPVFYCRKREREAFYALDTVKGSHICRIVHTAGVSVTEAIRISVSYIHVSIQKIKFKQGVLYGLQV